MFIHTCSICNSSNRIIVLNQESKLVCNPCNKKDITYVVGDATSPVGEGLKVIIHCCNDIGGWGSGFVVALSKKWEKPERHYRDWAKSENKFELGMTQYVGVEKDIVVANMIGQRSTGYSKDGIAPIRYSAIKRCLRDVYEYCHLHNASVHAPRFGAGLAGGDWAVIEKMIQEELTDKGINVTIYDFEDTASSSYIALKK